MITTAGPRTGWLAPLRLALWYALGAALWVALSDGLLDWLGLSPADPARWQTYRGWAFVGVTALLLYVVARREVQALSSSEARYRSLVDLSPDSIWITQDERIVFANAACLRSLGATRPEQVIGKTPFDFIHPDYHAAVRERIAHMLTGAGGVPPLEEKFVRLDGTLLDVEVVAAPLGDDAHRAVQVIHRDITQRKQAQEALKTSERLYRALAHNFPNGAVLLFDLDLRYIIADGAGLRAAGLVDAAGQGLEGRTVSQGVPPELAPAVEAQYRAVLAGETLVTEIEYGGRLYEAHNLPIRDEQGAIVAGMVMTQDLTDRKRAEAAVAHERDFINAALDSLPGVVYLYGADRKFLRWNRNFEVVSGYTAAEIAQMHPLDFFAGDDRDLLARQIQAVFDQGEGLAEAGFVTRSGAVIPYYFTGKRIELDGRPCLIGMGIDLTERKRAEEAVRLSRQRLQATLDFMLEGCQLIGFDWRYLYLNDAAVEQNRRSRQEMEGRTMLEVYPGLDQSEVFAVLRRSLEGRTHERLETEFIFPEGVRRWFDLSVQPVEEGIFILSHDVTERKQRELEIRQLNADLEQRVLDRTAELAVSNARLTVKNEELKGFAYTVSHDLKAPLRGIAGYAQELERRHSAGLTPRAEFCLTQILTATRNLDRLIEDLLQYSRLEAEVPSASRVNVPALLDSLLRDRAPLIAERGAQVSVTGALDTATTWPRGLMQVLANLIDNALKYSRGAALPQVTIASEARAGVYHFMVRDNGIGFDMKYHDRIFGLFNRLVRPEEFEGTGAGLAIVKKLIDKMGGRIWAESAPGAGATFYVELPRPAAED